MDILSKSVFAQLSSKLLWGPFLVVAGIFLIYLGQRSSVGAVVNVPASFLIFSGVALMYRLIGQPVKLSAKTMEATETNDADYVVKQLSRNFEILPGQTTLGFILSGLFMSIGLMLIAFSLLAPSFGINAAGVEKLGIVAGIITEFISGTAMVLYRVNFTRLNEVSDKLDDAWRVLAAFKLTAELPEEQKALATLTLINSLASSSRQLSKLSVGGTADLGLAQK